jgi:hypothetical protein
VRASLTTTSPFFHHPAAVAKRETEWALLEK